MILPPNSAVIGLTTSLSDLQTRNIHLETEEDSILKDFEAAELDDPILRKIAGARVIYESWGLQRPERPGRSILCNLVEARFGQKTYTDDVQPFIYQAPEITIHIPWTYTVDIWNARVMVSAIPTLNILFMQRTRSVLTARP